MIHKFSGSIVQKYRSRMTNWQVTKWVRAGRPTDEESLWHFATLPHWKTARIVGALHLAGGEG